MIKKISAVLLIAVYALSCAGCCAPVKKDRLVMWLVGSEAQARTIMELSEGFREETGVSVECQAISWGNAHSKYLTSIAGEVTPDIGTMGLTWGMEFGELGALLDLRAEFPGGVAELEEKTFPGIAESTKLGDKVFGIPLDMSIHVMYYRTDIIPDPPATWEELEATLLDLKARDKGMVLDWGSLQWIGFAPFLWQAGGDFFNKEYTEVTLDSPEAARALDFLALLYKSGVPKTAVPLEQGMRTGDYPLAISGNWKIISLTLGAPEIKDKWGIAMLPAGPSGRRTAFIGGRIMGVFARSSMKEKAFEFIKFLSRPEIQVRLYEASLETEDSYLPPNMDTWKKLTMGRKFKKVLEEQARDAKGPPPVLGWDAGTRFVNH
ncbi:MAG: extracellular solute-binding protein, partial [Candidatus Omnitrophica bacterium]|nr:extracellular solute-binding protein [Candidatus Omnitrophota bacterium]